MDRYRSVAVPLGTALGLALAVPALAPAAWAADAPASVAVDRIDDSGFVESTAFDAAWSSTEHVLYTGESHDDGSVTFAPDGSLVLTTGGAGSSQAFGLVPAHVRLKDIASEPTLVQDGTALGLQLRGDADGDGTYDADDYFTLVRHGQDDWQLSNASGTVAKGVDPGAGHHALADWQAVLSDATIQDVGVSLGSGAPSQSATLTSLTFAGTTYEFHAPRPFTTHEVAIGGTAVVGGKLTATPTFAPSAGQTYQYRWLLDGAEISGATASTYVPVAADLGHKVSVRATASADGYDTATATSDAVTIGAASFTKQPTPSISGTVRVGTSVKAVPGTWSPGATFTYQWKVNGSSIKGATKSTYTPAASYRGKKLTVTVTAKRSGYTTVTKTSASKTVGYGVLSAKTPTISGNHQAGHTLTAHVGTWSPKPSYSYRWKRNGASIKGATHSTYKLTSADKGKKITVTVTGKKSGYTTRSVTSASITATVPFARTYAPTITGTTRVSSTLTAHVRTWSPTPSKSYQWLRDGKAISGAKHSTYQLTAADHGHKISVKVTGTKSAYTTTSRTSSKTATIAWPKGISTPKVTSSPKSVLVTTGKTATFSAKATGGSLKYQWQYSDDLGDTWHSLSGKTSSKLTVTAKSSLELRDYRVVVSNVAGKKTSADAVLFVTSSRSDHFVANQTFHLDGYLAVAGSSYRTTGTYGESYLAAPMMVCGITDTSSLDPWLDLSISFIGKSGRAYEDDAWLEYDDISNVYYLDSDGCASFTAYAEAPSSDTSGGVWRITDDSFYNGYGQYVR